MQPVQIGQSAAGGGASDGTIGGASDGASAAYPPVGPSVTPA